MENPSLNVIKEFELSLKERDLVIASAFSKRTPLEEFFKKKAERIFKRAFPKTKRKFSFTLIQDNPEFKELQAKSTALGHKYFYHWDKKKEEIELQLYSLANEIKPEAGDRFNLFHTSTSYSYYTQGFGASSYARNEAERYADKARLYNLPVEIRSINEDRDKNGISHSDFEVWVKTDSLTLEVLKRKSDVSIVEQVRLCWKRGVNPRVFWYWLSPNFEAENGLDFQGNKLTK